MAIRYGTCRICALRLSHFEPYRISVPYFSSIFEAYHTNVPYPYHYKKGVPYQRTVPVPLQKRRTVPTYRTSQQKLRRTVPYLRPVPYRTAILGNNSVKMRTKIFKNYFLFSTIVNYQIWLDVSLSLNIIIPMLSTGVSKLRSSRMSTSRQRRNVIISASRQCRNIIIKFQYFH